MEFTCDKHLETVDYSVFVQGLANHGALCYAISILHTLYHVPSLRQSVMDAEKVGIPVIDALKRVFMYISKYSMELPPERLLNDLFSALYPDAEVFDTMQQKDACEFFIDLVSSFNKLSAESNPFVSALRGEVQHTMQVTDQPERRKQFSEKFFYLSMDVQNLRDLKSSLQHFSRPVDINFRWETGQAALHSIKQAQVSKAPQHLLLHLNRFKFDLKRQRKLKLNSFFSFPQLLDMTPYLSEKGCSGKRCVYRLSAVVIHRGSGAYSGHYFALIRVPAADAEEDDDIMEDRWVKMDDDRVTQYDVDCLAADAFGSLQADTDDDDDADEGDDSDHDASTPQSAKMLLYELMS